MVSALGQHALGVQRSGRCILLIEDDEDTRLEIRRALEAAGHWVQEATRDLAPAAIFESSPDLIVLDLGPPPEGLGLEALARIRTTSAVPLLALGGRVDEPHRAMALRVGADDYLVTPCSAADITARVVSVLRDTELPARSGPLVFDGLVIDPESREVTAGGLVVALTPRELDVLIYLASTPRKALTREQLLQAVWGSSSEWQDPDTVTEHIRRIRRKIDVDPADPSWIHTVRGVGYLFEPAVTAGA
jgi:DNA-binding response OmpR family regulator